jgi:DNA-binding MarR family transcriptional regulator
MVACATIIAYDHGVTEDFRMLLQEFIRQFGLLAADRTPCGKPLASSDAHALMLLLEAGDDGMLSSTLATKLGIDKSTASRTAARLTDSGHITAGPSSDDARARPIQLTKKGARVAREVEVASRDRFARLLKHLPPRRRADIIESLRDLVAALQKMTPTPGDQDP